MGCNSLRTSHNPPTPELLDACDELGMLVFDETRMMSSNPEGLSQFENLVRRDRNHPSVFMWSMGNEEGQANTEKGLHILTAMKEVATRVRRFAAGVDRSHPGDWRRRPGRCATSWATTTWTLAPRPTTKRIPRSLSSARRPSAPWARAASTSPTPRKATWDRTIRTPPPAALRRKAGGASAMRGRGSREASCGRGSTIAVNPRPTSGPTSARSTGLSIPAASPKTRSTTTNPGGLPSRFCTSSRIGIGRAWKGKEIAVWVYSNLDKVELFLNGQSLGAKEMKKDSHLAWIVKYAPGAIEARGYKDGKQVMTAKRETTGPAAKLVMNADRKEVSADGEDVAMFAVEVHDAQGRVVPISRQRSDVPGLRRGKTDRRRQRRPHQPRIRQGHIAKSLLRSLHGPCPVYEDSRQHHRGGDIPRTRAGQRYDCGESRDAPSPSGGLGTRGAGGFGHHRPVEADTENGRRHRPARVAPRRWHYGVLSPAGWEQPHGNAWRAPAAASLAATMCPLPIEEGKVDGDSVSFKAGNSTYSGTLKGDQIELQRKIDSGLPAAEPPRGAGGAAPGDWASAGWIRSVEGSELRPPAVPAGSASGSAVESHQAYLLGDRYVQARSLELPPNI